jgi:hypothetical protein
MKHQLVIWQRCKKSGREGHFSFQTKQNFIPRVGELFSAPPIRGRVIDVTHDLTRKNSDKPIFVHFIQIEASKTNFASVFDYPDNVQFTAYGR